MSDDPRIPDRPEEPSDAATLGEYVLGLLPAPEAAEVESRLPREPALAAEHGVWADAVVTLVAGPDVRPPAGLRARIEARLFGAPSSGRAGGLLGWLTLLGAPAVAFAAAFFLLQPATFDPTIHVDIVVADAGLTVAAGADEDTLRIINVDDTAPAPGRAFEVWLIAGDAAPVSLGLLPASGSVDLPRPAALATGVVIAVSDEPAGGSPTGAPTGPILGAEPFFDL